MTCCTNKSFSPTNNVELGAVKDLVAEEEGE